MRNMEAGPLAGLVPWYAFHRGWLKTFGEEDFLAPQLIVGGKTMALMAESFAVFINA